MAGTTRTFQDMLNDYLPNELLREEFQKRDYFLSNVEKDDNWMGGPLIVPFEAASASSVTFGTLAGSTDISEYNYQRGEITNQPEVWGSLIFNHRDLMQHNKLSEQNFLKMLPGQVENFMNYMKMAVSLSITNGPVFATATADGDASGNLTVDRPDRFVLGQKVKIDDSDSAAVTGYVRAIDMNTNVVNFYDARTGGSAVNLSGYTTAQAAKCYFDGTDPSNADAATNKLSSIKDALLSATNGGSSTLYGKTKVTYPYLQAINTDGSQINASNILEVIFNAFTNTRVLGKGDPSKVVMSYKHLGSVMKVLEAQKGAYHIDPTGTKVSAYGWTEIDVLGVKGRLTVVGIQEMDDDWIGLIDMRSFMFYSNGFFQKRKGPNGNEYFEIRATTGFSYIVDSCLAGDLVCIRPSYSGIIYSIPSYSVAPTA